MDWHFLLNTGIGKNWIENKYILVKLEKNAMRDLQPRWRLMAAGVADAGPISCLAGVTFGPEDGKYKLKNALKMKQVVAEDIMRGTINDTTYEKDAARCK